MYAQLDTLTKRFEEITALLADPAVLANALLYQALTKELASCRSAVETYRAYRRCREELRTSEELARTETDPAMRRMAEEEAARLRGPMENLEQQLKTLLIPKDPNDERNVLLEIRAGTGGGEAALFAGDLYRMYARFAERRRWKMEVMDVSPTDLGGIKEVIALISGAGPYAAMKFESGVHRVQRVPRTEASGRIHTSAVTVAVLPEAEEIDVQIEEKDLRIDVFRSSGPGGQGVNTTDSAVRLTHLPTGIVVTCRDERSQHKNRSKAMKILRARLLEREQRALADQERIARKSQIGSGDRSEKIRTYNFPQNRVTDHRIGLTVHQLDRVLEGDLDQFVSALQEAAQAEALKSGA